ATPGGRKSLPFTPGDEMLAFLEGANAPCADRGCGVGSCHTCKLKVLKGRENVTMITDYDDSGLEKNEILPCCSSVKGPVEVEKG
ncbi:MAG: (2Fe-2S)-binding protein, partial [Planctomycetes bacterium]|nr:(2Fe-2S)-binding protein [Planctomycetota bacterium]